MTADPRPVPGDVEADVIRNAIEAKLFASPASPTRIEHFVLLRVAGAGAMGIVYRAYDPELQREVALKLVHPELVVRDGVGGQQAMSRLLREARAAARVTHPNVAVVHQVGMAGEDLYIAMEFVDGVTLRQWGRSEPRRPWRQILDMFIATGEGLAAAHDVGVSHRDFKPDNVLVGDDQRPRIVDFGLAAADRAPATNETTRVEASAGHDTDTWTDAARGTPAYMSPEQHRGVEVTERSDQFSYCVALWEALCGARPYAGDDTSALATAVTHGERRGFDARGAPEALAVILARGLDPDPGKRFPSMAALLEQLRRVGEPRSPTRRRLIVLAAALSGFGVWYLVPDNRPAECRAAAEATLATVYDAQSTAELAAVVRSASGSYGAVTWAKAADALDDYAAQWSAASAQACVEGERQDWAQPIRAASAYCLEARLADFEGTLQALRETKGRFVQLARSIRSPESCTNLRWLRAQPTPDDRSPDVVALARKVARYSSLVRGWELSTEHLERGQTLVDEAIRLGATAEHAAALTAIAAVHHKMSEYAIARDRYLEAHVLAGAPNGSSDVAATAAVELAVHEVLRLGDRRAALQWADLAQMWLDRAAATPDDPRRASVWDARGFSWANEGNFVEARRAHAEALTIRRRGLGETHPAVAATLTNLANTHFMVGELERADALYAETVSAATAALGPRSIHVASALANRGLVRTRQGKYTEALELLQNALAIQIERGGLRHVRNASSHAMIANAYSIQSKTEEAVEHFQLAVDIYREQKTPPRGLDEALEGLGLAQSAQGHVEEAVASIAAAVDLRARVHAKDHPMVLVGRANLAHTLFKAGRFDEADDAIGPALDEAEGVTDDTELAVTIWHTAALIARAQGRPEEAAVHLRAAAERLTNPQTAAERELRQAVLALQTSPAETRPSEGELPTGDGF